MVLHPALAAETTKLKDKYRRFCGSLISLIMEYTEHMFTHRFYSSSFIFNSCTASNLSIHCTSLHCTKKTVTARMNTQIQPKHLQMQVQCLRIWLKRIAAKQTERPRAGCSTDTKRRYRIANQFVFSENCRLTRALRYKWTLFFIIGIGIF